MMNTLGDFLELLLGLSRQAQDLSTAQVCLRAVLVFFILLLIVRLGKKRFLGQATAFDAVLVIIIGSIASRAISGTAPFVPSIAGTAVLVAIHWLVSLATRDNPTLSGFVKGHSSDLVINGKVQRPALRDAHMSDDDLAEDLRQQGVEAAKDVKSARLERSGKLSVIKKSP
jgi:uncharacterized membrane protein YcaP (DUF421 family)